MFRVKIDDFTSLQSCAILPSKMVFHSTDEGHNPETSGHMFKFFGTFSNILNFNFFVFRITRPKYHVTRAADVIWVPEDQFSMAESKASKGQRGRYCVAGAPSQRSC